MLQALELVVSYLRRQFPHSTLGHSHYPIFTDGQVQLGTKKAGIIPPVDVGPYEQKSEACSQFYDLRRALILLTAPWAYVILQFDPLVSLDDSNKTTKALVFWAVVMLLLSL